MVFAMVGACTSINLHLQLASIVSHNRFIVTKIRPEEFPVQPNRILKETNYSATAYS